MTKFYSKLYVFYLFCLLLILLGASLQGCSNGWFVGGYELAATDTMYNFVEILDQDSSSHFYANKINVNQDNWCFTHNQWELITSK